MTDPDTQTTTIPRWAHVVGFVTGISVFGLLCLACIAGVLGTAAVIASAEGGYSRALAVFVPVIMIAVLLGLGAFGMARLTNWLLDERIWRDRFLAREECPSCWYSIRNLESARCPECGERIHVGDHQTGSDEFSASDAATAPPAT